MKRLDCGPITVVVSDEGIAHMLARCSTRYWLTLPDLGIDEQYLCQCCCSSEVRRRTLEAVETAKAAGASLILMRLPWCRRIADVPVMDIVHYTRGWT